DLKVINICRMEPGPSLGSFKFQNWAKFLLFLLISQSIFHLPKDFFLFHRLQQISESMNGKGFSRILAIGSHIDDLYLFILQSDLSGCLYAVYSFHVNVQKQK